MKYISTLPIKMINQISGVNTIIPENSVIDVVHVTEIHGYENTVVVEFMYEGSQHSIERDTFTLCFKCYNDTPIALNEAETYKTPIQSNSVVEDTTNEIVTKPKPKTISPNSKTKTTTKRIPNSKPKKVPL